MDYLKGLMEERETLAATIETYATKAAERGSDLTEAETAEVKRIQVRCSEIDDRLGTFASAQESSQRYADLQARIGQPKIETRETSEPVEQSLADAWLGSDEFRGYQGRGTSSRFHYGEERAPFLTSGMPGLPKARVAGPSDPMARFPLFGLVSRETVSSGAFDYVKWEMTDAAAKVAEGSEKPEATLTQTLTPGTLDTIAHWLQVSRQSLEDEGRLRSIVDGKLTLGVQRKVHAEIMAALVAATIPAVGGDDLLKAIRVGIGTVDAAGYSANAVLLNPADYADLDISMLAYSPMGAGVPGINRSFWGLTPVADVSQPAGTATVGDFTEGVSLFERSGVSVYATDSHGETFTSNIFTILAEVRAKAVVINPAALVECSATAPLARSGK